jgi:hypothetical protein
MIHENLKSTFYLYATDKIVTRKEIQVRRKTLKLEFTHDLLNGYLYNNSIDDSSTNFDGEQVRNLVVHQTTKEQALQLLGDAYSVLRLPTNLFQDAMNGPLIIYPTKQETEAIVYFHSFYSENGGFGNKYRILILTFDSENVLFNYRYVDSDSPRVYINSYR